MSQCGTESSRSPPRAHLLVTRNKIVKKLKCSVMIKVHIDTWMRSTKERHLASYTHFFLIFFSESFYYLYMAPLFSAGLQDAFMNVVPLGEINSV